MEKGEVLGREYIVNENDIGALDMQNKFSTLPTLRQQKPEKTNAIALKNEKERQPQRKQ